MRYTGELLMEKLLNEYIESDKFELGKAGYIKEDGTFIFMEEYHGEDDSLKQFKYPEFSNTHPEEDTCIRIFDEPNELQYKKLEEIIDLYLDTEEYCKVEIWNKGKYNFYKAFSLREGACEDYYCDENIGNWTGYKLVKIIKNYFHQLNEQLLLELNRGQLINKSKSSDNYKDTSKGRNRWERRNKSKIATRVDQYNKIDMNSFFKNDELKVGINVHGETSDYVVVIRYNGVLKEIADQIKRNNNKLEFKCILIALQRVFNQGNVFVSCSCADWKYRIAYHATRGGYNSGNPEMRASDITNPKDSKGAGCKHVNLVLGNIDWIMKVSSVINNYIHYMEDHFERKYADLIFPKLYGMPYQKAIQLNLFDTDDNLSDNENEIKLSNRYGRERTKFRPDRQVNNMRNFNKQSLIDNTNKPTLDLNMNKVKDEIKNNIRTNNISHEEQDKKEDI